MIPSYTSVKLEILSVVEIEVGTEHLGRVESVASAPEISATSASRKSHIVGIVGISEKHRAHTTAEHGTHKPLRETVLCSV